MSNLFENNTHIDLPPELKERVDEPFTILPPLTLGHSYNLIKLRDGRVAVVIDKE